jgi:ribosomal protein L32
MTARYIKEAARRAGASILGTHFTGVRIDPDHLPELLDYREHISDLLLNQLKDVASVQLALAVAEITPAVCRCDSAMEIATLNVSGRRRLADALFVLGRVEAFVWLSSVGATIDEAKTILDSDKHWRAAIKRHAIDPQKIRPAATLTPPTMFDSGDTPASSETERPKRKPRKTKAPRELPPPSVDPITGKIRRTHRIRKKVTKKQQHQV